MVDKPCGERIGERGDVGCRARCHLLQQQHGVSTSVESRPKDNWRAERRGLEHGMQSGVMESTADERNVSEGV